MEVCEMDFRKLANVTRLATPVVPVAVQDVDTGDVLMVAYASEEAVAESIRTGRAVFWSTSKDQLHRKGASSGDVLDLVDIRVNCEANSLLYRVRVRGRGACHTTWADGRPRAGCFYRPLLRDATGLAIGPAIGPLNEPLNERAQP